MLQKYCTLVLFLVVCSTIFAQDFHHRQAESVEELLYKKDRNKALALFNKEKFLVVENLRTNQRNRYFVGDLLSFKTKDGFVFADDIYEVKDSSFVVTALNETTSRYEYVEIKLNEVTRIYKRPKRKVGFGWQSFSPFGYLVFEWVAWGVSPLQNNKWPIAAALTVAQPLFTVVSNQFRSRRITENYRLRVFQSF
ncbi:hypothetical protein [Emticicia sp. W12TSBA100-4]|uniref:hypothetical protein n=1 Tax=Emticicia sp. W12TSBA100-4 TaxID=3160965 RepID=UPI003305D17E